jgi:hypothetical protein
MKDEMINYLLMIYGKDLLRRECHLEHAMTFFVLPRLATELPESELRRTLWVGLVHLLFRGMLCSPVIQGLAY